MKKLILAAMCVGILILVYIFSTNDSVEEKVKKELESVYSIKILDKMSEESALDYVRMMKADDMYFYMCTYSQGNGTPWGDTYIYTSILSSVYEKYKSQIENLGMKYDLNVKFNFSANDYNDHVGKFTRKGPFITINANSNQKEAVKNFINEILLINEIQSLYDIWLKDKADGNTIYNEIVYDFSAVIIEGEDYKYDYLIPSIFEFYKSN